MTQDTTTPITIAAEPATDVAPAAKPSRPKHPQAITVDEYVDALTGYDEVEIPKRFGADYTSLDGTLGLRALVWSSLRAKGISDDDAYDQVMKMKQSDVVFLIADDEDEVFPDEPTTESGKGE